MYSTIRYNMQYVFRLCIYSCTFFIICYCVFLDLLCMCAYWKIERKKTRSSSSIDSCDNIVRDILPYILRLISVFFWTINTESLFSIKEKKSYVYFLFVSNNHMLFVNDSSSILCFYNLMNLPCLASSIDKEDYFSLYEQSDCFKWRENQTKNSSLLFRRFT